MAIPSRQCVGQKGVSKMSWLKTAAGFSAAATLLLSVSSAKAETANFGGFYGGGHIGYAYGFPSTNVEESEFERVWDLTPDVPPPAAFPAANSSLEARDGEFAGSITNDLSGVVGGLHVGYTHQITNVIFGIEGGYNWSSLSNTTRLLIPEPELEVNPASSAAAQARTQAIIDALAAGTTSFAGDPEISLSSALGDIKTLKGRIGVSSGNILLYGVGGAAWSNYRASLTSPPGFSGGQVSGTVNWGKDVSGWVAGGGFEYKISTNLSLRAEALHYDFGKIDFDFTDVNNIETLVGNQELTINEVNIGLSYYLN